MASAFKGKAAIADIHTKDGHRPTRVKVIDPNYKASGNKSNSSKGGVYYSNGRDKDHNQGLCCSYCPDLHFLSALRGHSHDNTNLLPISISPLQEETIRREQDPPKVPVDVLLITGALGIDGNYISLDIVDNLLLEIILNHLSPTTCLFVVVLMALVLKKQICNT